MAELLQVRVEVETCENLRTLNPSGLPSKMGSGGSYGFVEKVVDGITVTVNSVLVILHSHVFTASFQVRYSFESYQGPDTYSCPSSLQIAFPIPLTHLENMFASPPRCRASSWNRKAPRGPRQTCG